MEGIKAELHELIALKRFAYKISSSSKSKALNLGKYLSPLRGRGMDFSDVRHYQLGDEIRHMDWRVTARTGRPHIKVYQEEKERPVMLLTDFNPSMYFGTRKAFKSFVAAKLSALIAWVAIKQGDKVGAFLFSNSKHDEFVPGTRETHILPLLSALSNYTNLSSKTTQSSANFANELLRLRRVTKPGTLVIIISDFYLLDKECEKQLQRLCAHNDIIFYHIADVLELQAPKPGAYELSDGSQELVLNMQDHELTKNYQRWCDTTTAKIQALCKRLNIRYTQVTSLSDLALIVRQTFPRRGVYA